MKGDEIVTIKPEDARNFRIGMRLVWPRWYQLTWWHRRWVRITRWWRPRLVVSAVDVENGIVTHSQERWSWRHWRWERV